MAGHNKWSKVKNIKGAIDAKRGKIFNKLSRELSLAAREGGSDPDMNAPLRNAIIAAKAQNMPNDTIDRAIKKGTGELGGEAISLVTYEGFAPGGIAIMTVVATDNKNRSAADIRSIFTKAGGNLGTVGCVAFHFKHCGMISFVSGEHKADKIFSDAIEAGADDVTFEDDGVVNILTEPAQLNDVQTAMQKYGYTIDTAQLTHLALSPKLLTEKEEAEPVLQLCETLENYDDTLQVHANIELSDDLLEVLGG